MYLTKGGKELESKKDVRMKPEGGEMLIADEGRDHEPRNASNFWKLKHTPPPHHHHQQRNTKKLLCPLSLQHLDFRLLTSKTIRG